MNELLPSLTLFPPGALSSSVITTVWVGVLVVVFLHLRFGMTLSGLVVPGYLVPLLIVKPLAALVTVAEAYLTWGLALLVSNVLLRRAGAAEMFGRDRFFLLILLSVVVRVASDGWALPALGDWLAANAMGGDPRGNLHSFGLIIISLMANQLWNAGLRRGSFQLFVYLGLTWLLVRYVLMPMTNFSISSLGYMYEDLASSILASPKAYIILLTAALIASRMNLRYGWDFNGILIPSLLALQWYQPEKLLVTFVEAFIILALARLLLRTPWLARGNIEGARQMLLFFNIGFFYKLALGWLLVLLAPQVKATDWFAFGYLLSTLLALRMFQKDIAVRMTRTTLQTSLVAVAGASVVGFALTLLPLGPAAASDSSPTAAIPPATEESTDQLVNNLRARLYGGDGEHWQPPTERALETFAVAITRLAKAPGDAATRQQAQALLAPLGIRVTPTRDGHVVVHDERPGGGSGIYVLATTPRTRLAVAVPAALDERGTADIALRLYLAEGARALALAGTRRHASLDGQSDPLLFPRSFFQTFHTIVGGRNTLQLRAWTDETARLAHAVRANDLAAVAGLPSGLWVRGSLPEDLDVARLERYTGVLTVRFAPPPWPNRQREHSHEGFAELVVGQDGMRGLVAGLGMPTAVQREQGPLRIDGYLQAWLLADETMIAPRQSERYRAPTLGELLFLDNEVVTPLLQLVDGTRDGKTALDERELDRVSLLADSLGYRLVDYTHARTRARYLILAEKQGPRTRHWGLLVLRVGTARPVLVELPRPLAEAGSFEFGNALFEQLTASALLVATAHPQANRDGSANVLAPDNTRTAFHATHQVWLREGSGPRLVTQVRGATTQVQAGADAVVALWEDNAGRQLPAAVRALTDTLTTNGITFSMARDDRAGSGHYVLQGHSMDFTRDAEFATLWLAPALRGGFGAAVTGDDPGLPYLATGLPSRVADLQALLAGVPQVAAGIPPGLRAALDRHVRSGDVVALALARQQAGDLQLEHVVDADSRQPVLLLRQGDALVAVFSLSRREPLPDLAWRPGDPAALRAFLDRRGGWLVTEAAP